MSIYKKALPFSRSGSKRGGFLNNRGFLNWNTPDQKKITFFDEIFFKAHLLVKENRFEAVPKRFRQCKPSKSRKMRFRFFLIFLIFFGKIFTFSYVFYKGMKKSSSEKKIMKKKLFWKTFFSCRNFESCIFQRTRAH